MATELERLADSVVSRIQEAADYQRNVETYQRIVASLPAGDPPPEIRQYLATPADKLPVSVPIETVMQIADYQRRDAAIAAIRAELIQKAMVDAIKTAHEAMIPEADRVAAIAAAEARRSN